MSWIGIKEPDAETVNMAVVCRLWSTPLMRTVFRPFKPNAYLPVKHKRVGLDLD